MICRNCYTEFDDSKNYCPECGAKLIRNRLTPKILVHQVNEQFLSIDNKFLRTFIILFKKPEDVINGYIDGVRKKYIDVLQYFAISLTLVGIQVFLMNSFFNEELESSFEFLKSLESTPSRENTTTVKNPIQLDINSFNEINNYQSVIYIVTIPFYAIATWLANIVMRDKRLYNFTEHLVINIYYYSQIIIITAVLSILFLVLGLNYLVVSGIISLLTFIYLFYTLKRVFGFDFWNGFAYFMLVMVAFAITGLAIGVLLGAFVLLYVYVTNS